jgi:FkbM family methyltransferase|tara:strand:+ start:635 stop:1354 length:720 start_codon:yes stop_codon:yes gene_type:complete
MFDVKSLNYEMDTAGMSMNEVSNLHNQMFVAKDWDWWYEVLPDDTVVDIGAGFGMFAAKALDAGAKRVYMIEPNKRLLKTACKNVAEHMFNRTEDIKVVPIHAAMGRTDVDLSGVYKSATVQEDTEEPKLMSFAELVEYHDLQTIDFLKVDANGAEFNILHHSHRDFLTCQVRHIAVRVNLSTQYAANGKFLEWRDKFLKAARDTNKLYMQDSTMVEKLFRNDWHKHVPLSFMVYIKNW